MRALGLLVGSLASVVVVAQGARQPDWTSLQGETMRHFQALLRLDTSNPPGNEKLATDYLKPILEREGIPVQIFARDAKRPNLVARLKGSGRKPPLLLMGHTDVVTVDAKKWTFPPFSATRQGGYVYGRGSLDDKPHVVAGLMIMLELKRLNVPLERDVVFLAEAGEEGTTRVGIDFMAAGHLFEIRAEYCLAEGGNIPRTGGRLTFASVETSEKIPRPIELTARGTSGHGSIPLQDNPVAHLSSAVAAVAAWRTPIRLNDTTREYFTRLATLSAPDAAQRYRSVLAPQSKEAAVADAYLAAHEPRHASMLRTSISPTIVTGGYRVNVIPSEAKATLDVRLLPDENETAFLAALKKVINDPAVDAAFSNAVDPRARGGSARLDTEAFKAIEAGIKKHYGVPTLPMMETGATDMAQLRSKGMQCYGVTPATDSEDVAKGFAMHSDQERILESELHRFIRFEWDIVATLAAAR